jgi:hypothetical protein
MGAAARGMPSQECQPLVGRSRLLDAKAGKEKYRREGSLQTATRLVRAGGEGVIVTMSANSTRFRSLPKSAASPKRAADTAASTSELTDMFKTQSLADGTAAAAPQSHVPDGNT